MNKGGAHCLEQLLHMTPSRGKQGQARAPTASRELLHGVGVHRRCVPCRRGLPAPASIPQVIMMLSSDHASSGIWPATLVIDGTSSERHVHAIAYGLGADAELPLLYLARPLTLQHARHSGCRLRGRGCLWLRRGRFSPCWDGVLAACILEGIPRFAGVRRPEGSC